MARVTAERAEETRRILLDAASTVLRRDGYSGLSTRAVATVANAPMSQIQYHFGSKQGLVLALFEYENDRLLDRQRRMFTDDSMTLADQWRTACDYLDDDLATGYVRILNELQAAGWSDPVIGKAVKAAMKGWTDLLTDVAKGAADRHGGFGPFEPEDIVALVASAFMGAESQLLSKRESPKLPIRRALRRVGDLIEMLEEKAKKGGE